MATTMYDLLNMLSIPEEKRGREIKIIRDEKRWWEFARVGNILHGKQCTYTAYQFAKIAISLQKICLNRRIKGL